MLTINKLTLLLLSLAITPAHAIDITVGLGGSAANCTTDTLAKAIKIAERAPGPNTIWVSRNTGRGYELPSSALQISNQDLEIVGGFDNCWDETPDAQGTDISGNGGALDPVFRIYGNGVVVLRNLGITLGDADANEGAGIDYFGNGTLEIHNSRIQYNHSSAAAGTDSAGGLRMRAWPQGRAHLALHNVQIDNNSNYNGDAGGVALKNVSAFFGNDVHISRNTGGQQGGGVRLVNSQLQMHGLRNAIQHNNVATGYGMGGGIYLGSASAAYISATSAGPLLAHNRAKIGGALAVMDSSSLALYSQQAGVPMVVSNNSAPEGAAIYSSLGYINLWNVELSKNFGKLITQTRYARTFWNRPLPLAPSPAVICTGCNVIHENGTSGPLIHLDDQSIFDAKQLRVLRNSAQNLVLLTGNNAPEFKLHSSLIFNNWFDSGVFNGAWEGTEKIDLDRITVTGNFVPGTRPIFEIFTGSVDLKRSIFDEPRRSFGAVQSLQLTDSMSNALGTPSRAIFATPIWAQNGFPNLIQDRTSPGVDVSPVSSPDIDGVPPIDLPNVSNGPGITDLGAFESTQ